MSFSVMLKSIMNNTMRILIWKIYVWDYWGPYAQHISRVELTKYANTKLFLRHLNKSKNSEIFILYKDLTLSEPSRDIKSYKGHENHSKNFKHFHICLKSGLRGLTPSLTVILTVKYPGLFYDTPLWCMQNNNSKIKHVCVKHKYFYVTQDSHVWSSDHKVQLV